MPSAPVDDHGTVLYFDDSGPPPGSTDYVTLVLVHGTCFHGAVYKPMIQFAAAHNLRLVLLNMRGYPGSTPYSAEELLSSLEGNNPSAQEVALQNRGLEIAAFLKWFIDTEEIPPIREAPGSDKLIGGLSILSWSGGNGPTLAMFAHLDKLSEKTKELGNTHLRSFVLYDPSSTAVGNAPPPGLKNVNVDQSVSIEDQARIFGIQVGSFYPPFAIPDSLASALSHPLRLALQDGSGPVEPRYIPTVCEPKMTDEQFRSMTHPPILDRTQHAIWSPIMRPAFAANVTRALYDCGFDDGSGAKKKIWPAVRVHVVWCDMTLGEAAWGAAVLKWGYEEAKPESRRPIEFHVLEKANHFVHWEEPERFVKFLTGII